MAKKSNESFTEREINDNKASKSTGATNLSTYYEEPYRAVTQSSSSSSQFATSSTNSSYLAEATSTSSTKQVDTHATQSERLGVIADITNANQKSGEFTSFVDEFEKIARDNTDAPAVIDERYKRDGRDAEYSYGYVSNKINLLAQFLIQQNLVPEEIGDKSYSPRVGLFLPQSVYLPIAILAVWKAGLAYVPISTDSNRSEARLRRIITDSEPQLILTVSSLKSRLFYQSMKIEFQKKNMKIEFQKKKWAVYDVDLLLKTLTETTIIKQVTLKKDGLAYVIYSSGTTGDPKGIAISHAGLVNCMHGHREFMGVKAGDRVAQFGDIFFDASLMEIMTALGSGATLVLVPQEIRLNIDKLKNFYKEKKITITILTPTMLGEIHPKDLDDLRCVISTGEKLKDKVKELWLDPKNRHKDSQMRLINGYGPSEVTIATIMGDVELGKEVHIGRNDKEISGLIPGLQLFVVKDTYNPNNSKEAWKPTENLPTNLSKTAIELTEVSNDSDSGELIIAGTGVGIGYEYFGEEREARQAALTQCRSRFFEANITLRSGEKFSGKVYRTADEVQWKTIGGERCLVHKNRMDRVIKISGKLIHPLAIENRFIEYGNPKVKEVIITKNKNESLNAFIICAPGSINTDAEKNELVKRLHEGRDNQWEQVAQSYQWCVITTDEFTSKIPNSASAKMSSDDLNVEFDAELMEWRSDKLVSNKTEMTVWDSKQLEIVVKAFIHVFDNRYINPQSNFDNLGGDSMKAVKLVSKLKEDILSEKLSSDKTLLDQINPTIFMRYKTVAAITRCITRLLAGKNAETYFTQVVPPVTNDSNNSSPGPR